MSSAGHERVGTAGIGRRILTIAALALLHSCFTTGYYVAGPSEPSWLSDGAYLGMLLPLTLPILALVCYFLECNTSEAIRVIHASALVNSLFCAAVLYAIWSLAGVARRRWQAHRQAADVR